MAVKINPNNRKKHALVGFSIPNTAKLKAAEALVNKIIVAQHADATRGWHPTSRSNGTLIIPPPIPNIPENNPAKELKNGYFIVLEDVHIVSSQFRCRFPIVLRFK